MENKNFIKTVLLLFLPLCFYLSSCCTKKKCDEGVFTIQLYNFTSQEVDTIIISKYQIGSNFNNPINVTIAESYNQYNSEYYYAYLESLDTDYEYTINIPSVSKTLTLSGFKRSQNKCNTCFPYTPKSEYYSYISEYKINGQTTKDIQLKIYK